MAINTKAIKRRMKSITNTKKITKAMEMVSAAKMRRAVEVAIRTRAYALLAREFLQRLSNGDASKIPLLRQRPISRVLVIFISSNRGLCGSFNSNLFRGVGQSLKKMTGVQIDMIGIGKKSALFAKKNNLNLTALFDAMGDKPAFRDILPISNTFVDGFVKGQYDKVFLAYTEYRSSVVQTPVLKQLLPISKKAIDAILQTIPVSGEEKKMLQNGITEEGYVFEPDLIQILSVILPQLVEVQAYQALLESLASEHSARMVAMKNASDAAGDMLSSLRLSFNKARQAAITQEISEIVGGVAALE